MTSVSSTTVGGRPRGGFTLVELLVTISIIAILASIMLGALFTSNESAKAAKTQAIIAKLNTLVMERWEAYRTRRLPIQIGVNRTGGAITENAKQFAARQYRTRLELMKVELPDGFVDLDSTLTLSELPVRSAVSEAYLRRYTAASGATPQYEAAECLYMIIAMMRDDVGREIIDRYGGDKDSDGLPEIHDGWGNPIGFIRRPTGFTSDLHADTSPTTNHDPFDPRRTDSTAWAVYPLIYSYGPDREPELDSVGSWTDHNSDGVHNDVDNIHNHLIEIR